MDTMDGTALEQQGVVVNGLSYHFIRRSGNLVYAKKKGFGGKYYKTFQEHTKAYRSEALCIPINTRSHDLNTIIAIRLSNGKSDKTSELSSGTLHKKQMTNPLEKDSLIS